MNEMVDANTYADLRARMGFTNVPGISHVPPLTEFAGDPRCPCNDPSVPRK